MFVGQQFASGGHDNFFKGRSLPSFKGSDIIVESVMENAKVHLERKLGRSRGGQFEVVDRSPRALLNEIRGHQGGFIEGNREVALDNVALKILEMVQDVSAGRLSADARDGIANSDKPDPVSVPDSPKSPILRRDGESWLAWMRRIQKSWRQDEALINQHPTTSQNGTNNNAGSSSNGVAGPSNEPRRNRGISNFFSSGFQNEAVGEAVSPVMALKAKQDRMERKKPKGKQRTGGLRRLLPSVETTLTPDQEVNDYLKRAGIEVGSPDAREDSHAAVELHRHQVEVSLERRAAQAHRSRVQHARHNLIRWFGIQKEDSEPLGDRRSQFDSEASVRSGKTTILDRLKRATTRRLTTVSVKSMVSPSARASVRPRSESSLNTARL